MKWYIRKLFHFFKPKPKFVLIKGRHGKFLKLKETGLTYYLHYKNGHLSKRSEAVILFGQNSYLTKQQTIDMFIDKLDVTKVLALSYYDHVSEVYSNI